jgi:hypothetical protein
MEIDSGSCHLAISEDRLSSTSGCHPISWNGLRTFKRRTRELEEEAEEGALHEAEEGVDGEVVEEGAQEAKVEVKVEVGEVKVEVGEVKGEAGEVKGEEAVVAAEQGGGDRTSRRRRTGKCCLPDMVLVAQSEIETILIFWWSPTTMVQHNLVYRF